MRKNLAEHKDKFFTALYMVLLFIVTLNVYNRITGFYVTAQFKDLGPVPRSMAVYYKGFKVGKTGTIKPDMDFKNTNIKIKFKKDMSGLPANVTANVRKFDDKKKTKYIEIEYPKEPQKHLLMKGSTIKGLPAPDLGAFMSSQLESGELSKVSGNVNSTITSVGQTAEAATDLLNAVTGLVGDMRPDILAATKNLSQTTEQINNLATKLNKSAPQKDVDNASENIGQTIANLEQITENINKATVKLNASMDDVNSVTGKLNMSMDDVNGITAGVKQTLGKRFGGVRMIMGTPLQQTTTGAAAPVGGKTLPSTAPAGRQSLPVVTPSPNCPPRCR